MKCKQCEEEVTLPDNGLYSAVFCSPECHEEFWAWWAGAVEDEQ